MPAPRRLVLLTLFAIGVAAPVSAQTSGVLRACVQQGSLQTRIISDTETCKSTETLVTWNLQGPKGDKGDKGDPGPQGDPGPKGDPGAGLDTGAVIGRLVGCVGTIQAGQNKTPFSLIGEGVSGITDADGRFRIQWLSPGGHELFAGGPQFHFDVTAGQTFDVGDLLTTNLDTNPFNCGACGHACGPTETCSAGVCVAHAACSGHGTLVGAICVCTAGWTGVDCSAPAPPCVAPNVVCPGTTTCVPSLSFCPSQSSCPAPGIVCPPASGITAGRCVISLDVCNVACASPAVTCADGFCANSFTECATHTVCLAGETRCADGRCVQDAAMCAGTCAAGQTNCGGACVSTTSDVNNCGGCGISCPAPANGVASCNAGLCGIAACSPGFANCNGAAADGCETNILTDVTNCGACGRACAAGQACVNGQCSGGAGSTVDAAASPFGRLLAAARLRHN